jgi:hypothetical protein
MPAATLKLTGNCLENMTVFDVFALQARMLWPNDAVARKRARTTSALQFSRSRRDSLPEGFFGDVFDQAFGAIPPHIMQQSAREPYLHGFIAGMILQRVVHGGSENGNSEETAMGRIIRNVSELFYPRWRLSPKTIENSVWPKFRSVSHFWAAYVTAPPSKPRSACFPCELTMLTDFLAQAEAFRRAGENKQTWRSPRAILLPGECVALPSGLNLPTVAPRFRR